jgi:hypothetical protein
MTAAELHHARAELARANERAERATWYGDPQGAAYATAQAAALRARIVAEMGRRVTQ